MSTAAAALWSSLQLCTPRKCFSNQMKVEIVNTAHSLMTKTIVYIVSTHNSPWPATTGNEQISPIQLHPPKTQPSDCFLLQLAQPLRLPTFLDHLTDG